MFFFFKQKTAYEMRISDWSSDVCSSDLPTQASSLLPAELWRHLAASVPRELRSDSASNAWVLDGSRTATGKPILANDPHLGFSAPGLWYLACIVTPEIGRASGRERVCKYG